MTEVRDVRLFSYGTLQHESVQRACFGRLLDGSEDAMPGFRQSFVRITDPEVLRTSGSEYHPIVEPSDDPGDAIAGQVFSLTEAELVMADRYEVSDYKRVLVRLRSGAEAWVYVKA